MGISEQDRHHISEFLNSLNFGNSQNIIGLSARYSDLPSLIDLDTLGENEKALFDLINQIGQDISVGFPPAWSRGLARWPKLLPIIWNTLSIIEADGRLERLKQKTKDEAFKNSSILASMINNIPPPEIGNQVLE